MALASITAVNQLLNGFDGSGSPVNLMAATALHTASPGTAGANENASTGGYARQATAWNAASSGSKTNSGSLVFGTAGTTPVTHVGEWTSTSYGAGTYGCGCQMTFSVTSPTITVSPGAIAYNLS